MATLDEIIADLEKLAKLLDTKANAAEAEAEVHRQHNEATDALKQAKRAAGGRKFADTCRNAVRILKVRMKKGAFQPPSLQQLIDYTRANHPEWPLDDVRTWWNHFESNGWLVSGRAQMRKWEQAADNGAARWRKANPEAKPVNAVQQQLVLRDANPEGWDAFAKAKGYPALYRRAASWQKTEFARSRK